MKVRAHPNELAVHPAILLFVWMPIVAAAGEWTQWRGPSQDGVSKEVGLPNRWSIDGTNVLWQATTGGRSTPIILNGRVYLNCLALHVAGSSDSKVHPREQVVCWDATTGEEKWRDEFNVFQTDISAERVGWASMAGDAETGNVYMHSVSGLFRCYSSDGKLLWEKSLLEEYGKISGYGGRTQTPIIDENRVIISFLAINWGDTGRAPPKHFYYAFEKRTGKLLWVSAPGGKPYDTNFSVPIVRVIDGVRMLIGGNSDGACYAIHARTGELLWGFRMSRRGINVSPVTDGKYVYIGHGEDNIDSLGFGRVQCIDATGRGDITDTHSVWRVDGIKAGTASLLVHDGMLYVVADTGTLHALDSKTGEELWTHNLGTMGFGSPVFADGKLYVTEVHGNIHILRPSREGCETLSHVYVPSLTGDGYDDIFASPAVANGRVYFVTAERTICMGDEKEDSQQPNPNADSDEATELPAGDKLARLHLVPYETTLREGDDVSFEVHGFDRNGHQIELATPSISVSDDLATSAVGNRIVAIPTSRESAGKIQVTHHGLTATARVRTFPNLPWRWDFEDGSNSSPENMAAGRPANSSQHQSMIRRRSFAVQGEVDPAPTFGWVLQR